jgi:hypothetical protein
VSGAVSRPWFVGAWRRRSIVVPGGEPTEPCEAWWIQSGDVYVDIRVTLPGKSDNGLPYSSTRAFAGVFEIADGESRWHVEIDSDGVVPRTDRAAAGGLYMSSHEPLVMIEDAPGRFREEWVQQGDAADVEVVRHDNLIAVRVGDVVGIVHTFGDAVFGRLWHGDRSISTV